MKDVFLHYGFQASDAENVAAFFKPVELKKGALFAKEGNVNTQLLFVANGLVQYFFQC